MTAKKKAEIAQKKKKTSDSKTEIKKRDSLKKESR